MKTSTIITTILLPALQAGLASAQDSEPPVPKLSEDDGFHSEILQAMGQILGGGADANPVLAASKNIKPGDWDSFTQVWADLANATKAQAMDPEVAYDPVNVRDTWFSVATYFRRADVFVREDWDDPRINEYWDEMLAAYDKAIAALPVPGQRMKIPADGFDVEAIWFGQDEDDSAQPRKTLILGNGFDAAQEDFFSIIVSPALARGWNVMTYEGPGQPTVRRNQDAGFIPDWERVLSPVVDYLLEEKAASVDPDQLVLFGNSLGGYFAARAAAFEPRLSAVMLDGGVWSTYDMYMGFFPTELVEMLENGEKDAFDEAVSEVLNDPEGDTTLRWGIMQGLWGFKTKSPYDLLDMMKEYTIEDIADQIDMPVWIADGEFETEMAGQSQLVKDALGDKATLHVFNGTAGYHSQVGASQELCRVMFAWLDKTLNKDQGN